jgi:hypothetical protein
MFLIKGANTQRRILTSLLAIDLMNTNVNDVDGFLKIGAAYTLGDIMGQPQSLLGGSYGSAGWFKLSLLLFFIAFGATAWFIGRILRKNRKEDRIPLISATLIFGGLFSVMFGGAACNEWSHLTRTRKICQQLASLFPHLDLGAPAMPQSTDPLDGPYLIYYCPQGKPDVVPQRIPGAGILGEPPDGEGLPMGMDDRWTDDGASDEGGPPGRANDMPDPLASAKYLVIVSSFVDHRTKEAVTVQEHIITHVPGLFGGKDHDRTVSGPRDETYVASYISLKAAVFDMRSGSHLYSKVFGPQESGDGLVPKLYQWLSSHYMDRNSQSKN